MPETRPSNVHMWEANECFDIFTVVISERELTPYRLVF